MHKNTSSESPNLWRYVEKYRQAIESVLREHLPLAPPNIETRFNEAVEYALFSGGKRLRPVLTLLGAELIGGRAEDFLTASAAVEYIHTSSLIFDDLPCMDDANERRGQTSLHEKFGEGLAVLVGIGFLNVSYALVFINRNYSPGLMIAAHREIVECVGAAGMIGGQSVDLALAKAANANDFSVDDDFESIRNLKTSALMRLALRVGAILAGANASQLEQLSRFADLLGEAYQLSDDLLDLEEDGAIFAEKHFALNRQEKAQMKLRSLIAGAKNILLENFPAGEARTCLLELTDYLAKRKV